MIKIVGSELWRGGEKVGYVEGHHIRNRENALVGYFSEGEKAVYSAGDHKIAYIQGDKLYSTVGHADVHLSSVHEAIEGGVLSEVGKCAIYVLLGA